MIYLGSRFLVKLIFDGSVLIPMLYMWTDAPAEQIVLSSVVLSLIAFFVGDQWILRKSNNTVATIADIGLSGLYFWVVAGWFDWSLSSMELLSVALVLGVVEAMFHRVLGKWDLNRTAFSPRD